MDGGGRLREVATLFLKLGIIGFGGPAAHVAMMRREVVERRRWVDEPRFLELFGASNLIPGPSSTQLAMLLAHARAGWAGFAIGGGLFILPAALIVFAIAWSYTRFGTLPAARWILYGVTPVIIGVIADAIVRMGKSALRGIVSIALAGVVAALYLLHVSVAALLIGAGVVAAAAHLKRRAVPAFVALGSLALDNSLVTLAITFLKIGSLVYGGGYVLVAFVRADFVQHLRWLTDAQLVDAIAIGQVTPGPVFTTATFVGYLVGGTLGAIVATVAIFIPSFVFAAAIHRLLPRIRSSAFATRFLAGTTAAAIGLMAAVTLQLGQAVIIDAYTAALAIAAFVVSQRFRVNAAWLALGGALAGLVLRS